MSTGLKHTYITTINLQFHVSSSLFLLLNLQQHIKSCSFLKYEEVKQRESFLSSALLCFGSLKSFPSSSLCPFRLRHIFNQPPCGKFFNQSLIQLPSPLRCVYQTKAQTDKQSKGRRGEGDFRGYQLCAALRGISCSALHNSARAVLKKNHSVCIHSSLLHPPVCLCFLHKAAE